MQRCNDATMQRCNDATMQRCNDATMQRRNLRAADARGDVPVAGALGRTHAPDHRRRFLHHLKNGGFAPPNGRVQPAVAKFWRVSGVDADFHWTPERRAQRKVGCWKP
jgi:hypothetical protein